jgi:hypothetical protein
LSIDADADRVCGLPYPQNKLTNHKPYTSEMITCRTVLSAPFAEYNFDMETNCSCIAKVYCTVYKHTPFKG